MGESASLRRLGRPFIHKRANTVLHDVSPCADGVWDHRSEDSPETVDIAGAISSQARPEADEKVPERLPPVG
jgi:hypothetical protein